MHAFLKICALPRKLLQSGEIQQAAAESNLRASCKEVVLDRAGRLLLLNVQFFQAPQAPHRISSQEDGFSLWASDKNQLLQGRNMKPSQVNDGSR